MLGYNLHKENRAGEWYWIIQTWKPGLNKCLNSKISHSWPQHRPASVAQRDRAVGAAVQWAWL